MSTTGDDGFTIRSPEGVALELAICGPGSRILAYSLDYIFIVVLAILILLAALFTLPVLDTMTDWFGELDRVMEENPGDQAALNAALIPLILVMMALLAFGEILYFTTWELLSGGRSLGKLVVKIRVIQDNGMPLTPRSSLIRNLLRFVDVLPSSYGVGLISIVLGQRNQRLGDMAAGTVVIRSNAQEPAPELVDVERVRPLSLTRGQLERLGDAELTLAQSALRRSETVAAERAEAALSDAAAALRERLEIEHEAGEEPKRFLERVVATAEVLDRRQ